MEFFRFIFSSFRIWPGFDVELAPGFDLGNPLAEVVQRGAILTVYRKVG